jgi:hypothetical protein
MTRVGPLKWTTALGAVVAALVITAVGTLGLYEFERATMRENQGRFATRKGPANPFLHVEDRGIRQPKTSPAVESGMRDDDVVVGVEVGGQARAYRLDALRDRSHHIVNDLIGGVPVSVAYCDINDCLRVYTDPRGSSPLDVAVGGLYTHNGTEMIVKIDGSLYFHESGRAMKPSEGPAVIPYDLLPPTRTTWKEWAERHPSTEVYVGDRKKDQK